MAGNVLGRDCMCPMRRSLQFSKVSELNTSMGHRVAAEGSMNRYGSEGPFRWVYSYEEISRVLRDPVAAHCMLNDLESTEEQQDIVSGIIDCYRSREQASPIDRCHVCEYRQLTTLEVDCEYSDPSEFVERFIHLLLLATALRSDVVLETFSAETSQYLMLCHAVQVRFRRPHNEEANEAFQLYGSEGP